MPLEFVVAVPTDEPLLIKLIVLFGSAIPSIVGVELLVRIVVVVIEGWAGGVLSKTLIKIV